MKASKENSVTAAFRGKNFCGTLYLSKASLSLDITQFRKGNFYQTQLTSQIIQNDYKHFSFFKNIEDLFGELAANTNSYVSDENSLIMSLEVSFKGKNQSTKIEIPLQIVKFRNDAQKLQKALEKIEKMNNEKLRDQKECLIAKNIRFRGDQTNPNYKLFQISENRRKISYKANNHMTLFSHLQPLPERGIFYFKVNVKTGIKIQLGICSQRLIPRINDHIINHTEYMGLSMQGFLYDNGVKSLVVSKMQVGSFTMKVVINMNNRHIKWFLNNNLLHSTPIRKDLQQNKIFPVVAMNNLGDTIQFVED